MPLKKSDKLVCAFKTYSCTIGSGWESGDCLIVSGSPSIANPEAYKNLPGWWFGDSQNPEIDFVAGDCGISFSRDAAKIPLELIYAVWVSQPENIDMLKRTRPRQKIVTTAGPPGTIPKWRWETEAEWTAALEELVKKSLCSTSCDSSLVPIPCKNPIAKLTATWVPPDPLNPSNKLGFCAPCKSRAEKLIENDCLQMHHLIRIALELNVLLYRVIAIVEHILTSGQEQALLDAILSKVEDDITAKPATKSNLENLLFCIGKKQMQQYNFINIRFSGLPIVNTEIRIDVDGYDGQGHSFRYIFGEEELAEGFPKLVDTFTKALQEMEDLTSNVSIVSQGNTGLKLAGKFVNINVSGISNDANHIAISVPSTDIAFTCDKLDEDAQKLLIDNYVTGVDGNSIHELVAGGSKYCFCQPDCTELGLEEDCGCFPKVTKPPTILVLGNLQKFIDKVEKIILTLLHSTVLIKITVDTPDITKGAYILQPGGNPFQDIKSTRIDGYGCSSNCNKTVSEKMVCLPAAVIKEFVDKLAKNTDWLGADKYARSTVLDLTYAVSELGKAVANSVYLNPGPSTRMTDTVDGVTIGYAPFHLFTEESGKFKFKNSAVTLSTDTIPLSNTFSWNDIGYGPFFQANLLKIGINQIGIRSGISWTDKPTDPTSTTTTTGQGQTCFSVGGTVIGAGGSYHYRPGDCSLDLDGNYDGYSGSLTVYADPEEGYTVDEWGASFSGSALSFTVDNVETDIYFTLKFKPITTFNISIISRSDDSPSEFKIKHTAANGYDETLYNTPPDRHITFYDNSAQLWYSKTSTFPPIGNTEDMGIVPTVPIYNSTVLLPLRDSDDDSKRYIYTNGPTLNNVTAEYHTWPPNDINPSTGENNCIFVVNGADFGEKFYPSFKELISYNAIATDTPGNNNTITFGGSPYILIAIYGIQSWLMWQRSGGLNSRHEQNMTFAGVPINIIETNSGEDYYQGYGSWAYTTLISPKLPASINVSGNVTVSVEDYFSDRSDMTKGSYIYRLFICVQTTKDGIDTKDIVHTSSTRFTVTITPGNEEINACMRYRYSLRFNHTVILNASYFEKGAVSILCESEIVSLNSV